MTSIYGASPAYAMVDSSKGSMTNRFQCSKEHLKNNLAFTAKMSVLGATGAIVAIKKPGLATKVATKVGQFAGKILSKLGKTIANSKFTQKILANPAKAGKFGLITAGALLVTDMLTKHIYKAGQIDQKYTDAALVEAQTKNIILRQKCTPEEIKEFYANGGKGIYC